MSLSNKILFATSNPHKIDEVAAILAPEGWEVVGLDTVDKQIDEPVEDQPTFEGNASLKAMYYARHTGEICLADDSGLEVDALDGQPGVHSARFAGVTGPRERVDAANNDKLVARLKHVEESRRTGRFVCAMALSDGERTLAHTRGEVAGKLLLEPRGENGFGYDPYFFVPELGCTTAELSQEGKNQISHRGRATRQLLEIIKKLNR